MTTWTLSELNDNNSVKPNDCPAVIIDSGASIEPIPFAGMIDISVTNDEQKIEIKKTWEF